MEQNNNEQEQKQPEQEQSKLVEPTFYANTLRESIKTKLKNSSDEIKESVIKKLTDLEIQKRIDIVIKGLEKKETIEKELKNLKPDVVTFDNNFNETKAWSKNAAEEYKKKSGELTKINNAINKALDNNEYDNLANLCK